MYHNIKGNIVIDIIVPTSKKEKWDLWHQKIAWKSVLTDDAEKSFHTGDDVKSIHTGGLPFVSFFFQFFLYETYRHWNENCWVQGLGSRLSEQNLKVGGNLSCECRKLLTTRVILSQNAKHDLLTFTRQSSTMHHLLRVKICWWRQMGWENGDLPLFDEARCRGQCWNCHRPRDAWSQDTQTLKGFSIGS